MSVSAKDVSFVTGEPEPERPIPQTRLEKAAQDVADIDDRADQLAERERRPGETKEKAHARLLTEVPGYYAGLKLARGKALKKNGVGDAAAGFGY
jgi:hypothetical protein